MPYTVNDVWQNLDYVPVDGVGSNASFLFVQNFHYTGLGSAVSNDGKLAVIFDTGMIRTIAIDTGVVKTLVGQFNKDYYSTTPQFGKSSYALLSYISSISLSSDNSFELMTTMYNGVVSYLNTSTGEVSQWLGRLNWRGNSDGAGTTAELFCPVSVVIYNQSRTALLSECGYYAQYSNNVPYQDSPK